MAEALAEQFKKVPRHTKTLFISGYTEDVITHLGALDTGTRFCKNLLNHQTLIRKLRRVKSKFTTKPLGYFDSASFRAFSGRCTGSP